jgi:hypothetical protein
MTVLHHPDQLSALVTVLKSSPTVVLYIGPDQIMPLTSVLGAIVGVALMFWNRIVGFAHKCVSLLTRRAEEPRKPSAS